MLGRFGGDPYRSWGSGLNARSGTYVGANAPKEQVLAFYDTELQRLGWKNGPNRGGLSTEMAVRYWDRDDLMLKVGILYNDQPDARLPQGATAYATAYTLELSYVSTASSASVP